MRRKYKLLIVAASALIISSGCSAAVGNYKQVRETQHQIKILQSQYDAVKKQKQQLEKTKADQQQQIQQKDQTEQQLRKQIDDLQALRAEQARQKALALAAPVYAAERPQTAASSVVSGCGDNSYANYIYMHESGCNLNAVNAGGCRGIGQACPGSKLPCGADYACQNAFFTQYANATYGGWAGAYNFWLNNHWW